MSLSSKPLPIVEDEIYKFAPYLAADLERPTGDFFTYRPSDGMLIYVAYCRDVTSGAWDRVAGTDSAPKLAKDVCPFLGIVRKKPVDLTDFDARWTEIESMIGLKVKERSVIHPTVVSGAFLIEFAPFWLTTDTHRSFATLFMRAFVAYGRPTLDQTLDACPLTLMIKPAVMRFLGGYTEPSYERLLRGYPGGHLGVVSEFAGLDAAVIATKLVKPPVAA